MDSKMAIQSLYDTLSDRYNILFIASVGPCNYGLGGEAGRLLSRAIVIPPLSDVICGDKTKEIVENEHGKCYVTDVRDLVSFYKSQAFVETLFAKHIVVNARYEVLYDALVKKRESIARADDSAALARMLKQQEASFQCMKRVSGSPEKALPFYTDVFRVALLAEKYIKGVKYEQALDASRLSDADFSSLSCEKLLAHATHLAGRTKESVDAFLKQQPSLPNKSVLAWLDDWLEAVLAAEVKVSAQKDVLSDIKTAADAVPGKRSKREVKSALLDMHASLSGKYLLPDSKGIYKGL